MACCTADAGRAESAQPDAPVPVIFDTDMGNDVDDALALAVLHALQSRGRCRLLAVTLTKDHDLAGPFVDAINTFYGRGDIPIGVVRNGVTRNEGRYLGLIGEEDDGEPRYPYTLQSGRDAPEATSLLRKTLAAQADASVVIAQVGFSTNLARLLRSEPDEHSPMNGAELVRRKVRLLSAMAGAFAPIGKRERYEEYNIIKDLEAARFLVSEWPTAIVFSGYEIGTAMPYPAVSIQRDFGYVPHHPIAEAYVLYKPPPHNRPTWDLTSVLHAVCPQEGYFGESPPGRVTVDANGATTFTPAADGPHRYLTLTDSQIARATEALVQLTSQPPK